MTQEHVWEREYRKPKFLTKENKPQSDVVRFVKFLKNLPAQAGEKISLDRTKVLDLGSGTGRNSFYFTELGSKVIGLEISKTAVELAQKNAIEAGFEIDYQKQNIGEKFSLEGETVDVALDVTSSNSLTEAEREVYLSETSRVLKSGGYFFVKALCKDGDLNAKNLLKSNPGKEKDTYIMPDTGIVERVWSKEDFTTIYEKYFKILSLEKKTNYTRMNDRSYKRNFWIAYMQK